MVVCGSLGEQVSCWVVGSAAGSFYSQAVIQSAAVGMIKLKQAATLHTKMIFRPFCILFLSSQ